MNREIGIPKELFSVEFPEQIRQLKAPQNKCSFEEILNAVQEKINKYSISDFLDKPENEAINKIDKMDKPELMALLKDSINVLRDHS